MSHTPGPWVYLEDHDGIYPVDGNRTTDMLNPILSLERDRGEGCSLILDKGDAELMAAAPDLLSALQYLYDEGPTKEAFEKAISAFEKAEGRSL